jgi:hypothetical protein
MFPTPMHPMVIRSEGGLAPSTEAGTTAGAANAAPAVTADTFKKLRRLIVLLTGWFLHVMM